MKEGFPAHGLRPCPAQRRAGAARRARADSLELPVYAARLRAPFAVLGIRTAQRGSSASTTCRHASARGTDRMPSPSVPAANSSAILPTHTSVSPCRWPRQGTAFRQRVWDALLQIPIGESRTYGELARLLHSAPRAVGGACGANPIALVIPCHRVVGTHGSLGGFMGVTQGEPIAIKRWLLAHEGYRFGA